MDGSNSANVDQTKRTNPPTDGTEITKVFIKEEKVEVMFRTKIREYYCLLIQRFKWTILRWTKE